MVILLIYFIINIIITILSSIDGYKHEEPIGFLIGCAIATLLVGLPMYLTFVIALKKWW
jgi:hypothetical protein